MNPPSPVDAVPRRGVIHVHTDHSDGGIDVPGVIAAAHAAELDFIVITDHNTISARRYQGYHDDLLVLVDVEISPSAFRNHLLALGLTDYPDLHRLRDPDLILDAVKDDGGIAWVPHPRGFRNLWCGVYNAPWSLWDHRVDGLEVGTFLVEWVESLRPWNLSRRFRDPTSGVGNPARRTLALWDRINGERGPAARALSGFVGIDAHYREVLGGRVRTPSYEFLFRTHNLVVWTPAPGGDESVDGAALYRALGQGDFVSVFGHRGSRGDFRFHADGDSLRLIGPKGSHGEVRLVPAHRDHPPRDHEDRDSRALKRGSDVTFDRVGRGRHRAEVWLGSHLWALTNPLSAAVSEPGSAVELAGAGAR